MSGESRKGAAQDQDQMRDQDAFREDPRGKQEVSDQQPETQPSDADESGRSGADGSGDGEEATGRDDPGQATGNPRDAG